MHYNKKDPIGIKPLSVGEPIRRYYKKIKEGPAKKIKAASRPPAKYSNVSWAERIDHLLNSK